ncbi:MAG TPA: hypothetical protein DEV93_15910 [Chloroflexi bacterium]|nr:hypothetical protein [Chloroflexota bacterium]
MTRLEEVEMSAGDAALLGPAVAKLERLLDASDSFVSDAAETAVPGSPMDHARTTGVRDAYDSANALIFSAEDHLRAVVIIVKHGPLPGFALYTLLRAAADAAVRAAYLLELGLTPAQRLGRTLNERLDNLHEQRKFMILDEDDHYGQSVEGLKTRATAHGVDIRYSKAKAGGLPKLSGFGEPQLSVTQLFERFLRGGESVHRYLSGYAHSKMWAQLPRARAESAPGDPDVAVIPTDLNVKTFVAVLSAVTELYDDDLAKYMTLAGYPVDVWRLAKQRPMKKRQNEIPNAGAP